MRDDLLRAQSQQRGTFGRQRQRFVQRVRVQRLAAAQHRGQALQRHAHHVVFRLLRRERRSRRLRVKAQHHRTRIARLEAVAHGARPQPPRRAEFRDLHQEFVVRVEEKRKLRREFVHLQARTAMAASTYAIAFASVKATSCTSVEPASRMW